MRLIAGLLDVIFPPKCVFCRRVLEKREREGRVCRRCRDELPYNEVFVETNGSRTESPQSSHDARSGSLDALCAPLAYRGNVRKAIRSFKFYDRADFAEPLGRFVADEVARRYGDRFDVLTWAPIGRKRRKKRGYDQAQLLAEEAAKLLGRAVTPTLEKTRDTTANSRLDASKRFANVRGVYAVTDRASVEGKRVLIIDDVYTTGATLGECARALRDAGAVSVIGATVALAGAGEDSD